MGVDRGPISTCLAKHGSNSTLEFHECMCSYDYYTRSRVKDLKFKHCLAAAEMFKMDSFYSYVVSGAVIVIIIVAVIAVICSFKWYMETKKNPCSCCSFFCCCNRQRRKRSQENHSVNVFEHTETGHTWSPVNLPPNREGETLPPSPTSESRDPSVCMNFCLSDPVQDCCEFFDCDIMWRKKSIYTIPIFGRKKQHHHLQRRPTRPAPPPPKAVVLPQVKNPEPVVYDDECEPVPEAPPSPEPVRTLPPKAMYVDPLAFLQRTFAKNSQPEREDSDTFDGKQEALYSKFKNMVIAKVKKSVSMASINKLGSSSNLNGVSCDPSGSGPSSSKKLKTASLASLHNLGDSDLDISYGSKRSLSLASLHMLHDHTEPKSGILDPRSRTSVMSTTSTATDDIPPSARKDEYIDLEEMSKRIEAKMQAARSLGVSPVQTPQAPKVAPSVTANCTPNFMPASAFVGSSFNPNYPLTTLGNNEKIETNIVEKPLATQYFPPIPASQGRPAVPARTAVGVPVYSVSPSGTLGRPKPVVPPRPPVGEAARPRTPTSPHTSHPHTLPHSPRLVKPACPPPPPPGDKIPIESSI